MLSDSLWKPCCYPPVCGRLHVDEVDERTRLPKLARLLIERLTNKTEPEGAGQETSRPLLSVRNRIQPGHRLKPR
jgi:hypothetical protein